MRATALLAALLVTAPSLAATAPAVPPSAWPLSAEVMIAADAARYAPPDLKRQLAKHRARLMAGVQAAAAAEKGTRDAAAHRAAAARAARHIAESIRRHVSFADVAYETGGLVHEVASACWLSGGPFDPKDAAGAPRSGRFLGFGTSPFSEPEMLAASVPAGKRGSARDAYDASVTVSTRLLAWIWRAAGGDASAVGRHPEASGPYALRGD